MAFITYMSVLYRSYVLCIIYRTNNFYIQRHHGKDNKKEEIELTVLLRPILRGHWPGHIDPANELKCGRLPTSVVF